MEIFTSPKGGTTVQRILTEKEYFAPKVSIKLNALLKMKGYVENHNKEIAWLGLVERINENEFEIYDVDMMKQNVSSVTAELHEEGLQEYAQRLLAANRYDELEKVRMWGHSHVNMDVSPSSQDEETFKEYYLNCDYFIRIIANKKNSLRLDIVLKDKELRFDNVKWEVAYPKEIEEEIKKKILLENKANEIGKNIGDFLDKTYKTIEAVAKEEVKKYVEEEKSIVPINRCYGYSYCDDDDDFSYYNSYYKKYEKEIEFDEMNEKIPMITLYKHTQNEMQVPIDEYFDDAEIIMYAEHCKDKDEFVYFLEDVDEFYFNKPNDWHELYNTVKQYYNMLCGV